MCIFFSRVLTYSWQWKKENSVSKYSWEYARSFHKYVLSNQFLNVLLMPVGLFDRQLSSSLAGAQLFNDKWCWGVWRSLCMQWETWHQMYSHTEIRVQLLWCLYVPFFVLPDLIRRITDSNCGTFIMDEKTRSSIINSLINNWGPPDPTEVSKGLYMESMCIYDPCTWWKKFLLRWKKLNLDSSVQKASLCSLNILEVWSLPRARRVQWDIFGQRMQSLRLGWESRGNPLQIPSAGMSFCLVWGSQVLCEFVSSYWNTQTSTMRAQISHAVSYGPWV